MSEPSPESDGVRADTLSAAGQVAVAGAVAAATQVPDGTQLVLEPDAYPPAKAFKAALVKDGIPYTSLAVEDLGAEFARLTQLGVRFTQEPTEMGPVTTAVLDDTCGNLIQLVQAH